ncbi:MAG: O-antigen ligase family protein [Burkholderiales bacterium]
MSGISGRVNEQADGGLRQVEFLLLVGFAFALPLYEAPKNILWALYVLVWIVGRARSRDFGGAWRLWDTLIAAWIASGFAAAAFAGIHYSEWGGSTDLLRYASVLWLVRRSGYTTREIAFVLVALVAGTAVTLLFGYWQLLGPRKKQYLELHSVGHVNHSAIYLAIVLGILASATLACWRVWSYSARIAAAIGLLSFGVSLVVMESRGAIGAAAMLFLALPLAWGRRSHRVMVAGACIALVGVAAVWLVQPEALRKHDRNVRDDNVLSYRDQIWRAGLEAWRANPWFGVGMDNYSRINLGMVSKWKAARGEPYDERRYLGAAHAHNLFVNTLAERGAIGFAALAAVLSLWLCTLIRFFPKADAEGITWALWGSAFSAWFVTCTVGAVNTTLHHEHGLLAVLCLGLWLTHLRDVTGRARAT